MELPNELRYNNDHSWVKVEDNIATVGITEPAAKKVQEFVFIQLPQKGNIKQGKKYVSVEAVKWSGHLTSPVSGEIVEVNDSLFDEPGKLNQEPYNNWIMKVKLDDPKEIEALMDAKEAKEFYSK